MKVKLTNDDRLQVGLVPGSEAEQRSLKHEVRSHCNFGSRDTKDKDRHKVPSSRHPGRGLKRSFLMPSLKCYNFKWLMLPGFLTTPGNWCLFSTCCLSEMEVHSSSAGGKTGIRTSSNRSTAQHQVIRTKPDCCKGPGGDVLISTYMHM